MKQTDFSAPAHWLNRTTLGVGLTSLLSDWSHEMATAILPAFLTSLGAGPGWLGIIEGISDGLSSVSKLAAGHFTDSLRRRKPAVLAGYALTTIGTGALALASRAPHVLFARAAAWLGRGARTPGRKALLAAAVPPTAYGRAFGFERMLDTLGAMIAPATALWLLARTSHNYSRVFLWTLLPGLLAMACLSLLVRESPSHTPSERSFLGGLRELPRSFRRFLLAVGVFGLGDFSHTLLILYATQKLSPERGRAAATSIAVGLYLLHNFFYAASAYLGGWLSDHVRHRRMVLVVGYVLAAVMAGLLVTDTLSSGLRWFFRSAGSLSAFKRRWRTLWRPNWFPLPNTGWPLALSRQLTRLAILLQASRSVFSGQVFRPPVLSQSEGFFFWLAQFSYAV